MRASRLVCDLGADECDGACPDCEDFRASTAPTVTAHASERAEVAWVVGKIRRLVERGAARPRDIAVLHRTNAGLDPYLKLVLEGVDAVRAGDALGDDDLQADDADDDDDAADCNLADGDATRSDSVTLATVHASKGREWPIVFLVGVSDHGSPNRSGSQAPTRPPLTLELEELRLLYVGMTRARRRLHITFVSNTRRRLTRFLRRGELAMFRHSLRHVDGHDADDADGRDAQQDDNDDEDKDAEPPDRALRPTIDQLARAGGEETIGEWRAAAHPAELVDDSDDRPTLSAALRNPRRIDLGGVAAPPLTLPACIARINASWFHAAFLQSLVTAVVSIERGLAPLLGSRVVRALLAPGIDRDAVRALERADSAPLRRLMRRVDELEVVAREARTWPPGASGFPPRARHSLMMADVKPCASIVRALALYSQAAVDIFEQSTGSVPTDPGAAAAWSEDVGALHGRELTMPDLVRCFSSGWDDAVQSSDDKSSRVLGREVAAARRMLVGMARRPPTVDLESALAVRRLVVGVMYPVAAADPEMLRRLASPGAGAFHPLRTYLNEPAALALVRDVVSQARRLAEILQDTPCWGVEPAWCRAVGRATISGVPTAVAETPGGAAPTVLMVESIDAPEPPAAVWARAIGCAALNSTPGRVAVHDVLRRALWAVDLAGWTGGEAFLQEMTGLG